MHQGNIFIALIAVLTVFIITPIVSPIITNLIAYSDNKMEVFTDFSGDASIYYNNTVITLEINIVRLVGVKKYYINLLEAKILTPKGSLNILVGKRSLNNLYMKGDLVAYTNTEKVFLSRYSTIIFYIPYRNSVNGYRGLWYMELPIHNSDGDIVDRLVIKTNLM